MSKSVFSTGSNRSNSQTWHHLAARAVGALVAATRSKSIADPHILFWLRQTETDCE